MLTILNKQEINAYCKRKAVQYWQYIKKVAVPPVECNENTNPARPGFRLYGISSSSSSSRSTVTTIIDSNPRFNLYIAVK